jgi:transcriptional regulator with XRE-family HTH domain
MKHWEDISYQSIKNAFIQEGDLIVTFGNDDLARVSLSSLLPYIDEGEIKKISSDNINYTSYEINISIQDNVITIPWDKIRVISDIEFSRFLAEKAEEQAKLVGVKLKRLREKKGIRSNELSERSGITAQTISRIEKGHQDVGFSNLKKLLASMGYSLKDLANEEIELEKEKNTHKDYSWLLKRLSKAGVDLNLVTRKIIPKNLQTALSGFSNEQPELLLDEAASYVSNIYGWSLTDIWSNSELYLQKSPAADALFKKSRNANINQIKAYSHYAFYLAKTLVEARPNKKAKAFPTDIEDFRNTLNNEYGGINLNSILAYAWDMDICVLPLNDPGVFHGATWNIDGKRIVILKQQTTSHARWIFDLLHELYHALVHLITPDDSIIELNEISPLSKDEDIREREANSFANQVLFDGKAEMLAEEVVQTAKWKMEFMKQAVIDVSKKHNIRVDSLANYLGYRLGYERKNWWGTVEGLQENYPEPFVLVKDALINNTSLGILNPIDQNLLSTALNINIYEKG